MPVSEGYLKGTRTGRDRLTSARPMHEHEGRMAKHMMPLVVADLDKEYIIRKIGGSPEVKKHLENLGFVVGGTVTVVTSMGGNLIVNVKEARVGISREMAQRIMI